MFFSKQSDIKETTMQIKCQLRELTSIEKLRNHLLSVVLKNASEEVETGNIG